MRFICYERIDEIRKMTTGTILLSNPKKNKSGPASPGITAKLSVAIMALLMSGLLWAGQQRALLIGINEYKANDPGQVGNNNGAWIPEDLKGAINDITLMQQVLLTRFGVPESNITRLEDQAATREAIISTMKQFISDTRADDMVYIHFSGHGSQVEDQNGDEQDGLDETILSYDARTPGVRDITDDELGRMLASLPTQNALVVLDSCHSGTATRSASQLRSRAVPLDPRGELYAGESSVQSPPASANYVLLTGAADYQTALDGPIDDGKYYGLFSLSMGRSLGRLPAGATVKTIHAEARREMQRIGEQFGLYSVPEPQLEAPEHVKDLAILSENINASRLAWARVGVTEKDSVSLENAGALAAESGSVWAIYPPGEKSFEADKAIATVTVNQVNGNQVTGSMEGRGQSIAPGSRAIQVIPAPATEEVTMRLDRMPASDRQALADALKQTAGGQSIRLTGLDQFSRYLVDRQNDRYIVHSAGGLQTITSFPADDVRLAARSLVRVAKRSKNVNEVLSLDNPASGMQVSVAVNPVDRFGGVRGVSVVGAANVSAFRVRRQGQTRDRSNSLTLEITTNQDSYLTIVDVDPEGAVAVLFPNAISERNGFYPQGFVNGGNPVKIPDALENNKAGFNWDYVPPTGVDTIRVFAANDLATAERIRAYLGQIANTKLQGGTVQRGGVALESSRRSLFPIGPVSPVLAMSTRGVATVATANSAATLPDWTAASVTVFVEE